MFRPKIKFFKFKLLICSLFLFSGHYCFAQDLSSNEISQILEKAELQAVAYQNGFNDLVARETKTFEDFKPNGNLKRKKVIDSNFLVFRSNRDQTVVSEFRNVIQVNGKFISKNRRSPQEFFSLVERSNSVNSQLKKIQNESAKYDDTIEINGLTLFQALILSRNIRPAFEFRFENSEKIEGIGVFVIGFEQTKDTPYISNDPNAFVGDELAMVYDVPKGLHDFPIRLKGKIWIDKKTFQVWREERELFVHNEKPFKLLRMEFDYSPSNYDILVPKMISLVQFRFDPKNNVENVKQTSVSFAYSDFTKTKTEVVILDDDEPIEN